MAFIQRIADEEIIVDRNSAEAVTDAAARGKAGALRILCVDDNPVCLRLVSEVLKRAGCRVQCAAHAEEAMAWIEREEFDLLVTDHDMPVTNGLMLVDRLKRTAFNGRIVVLSAGVAVQAEDAYRQLGVSDILLKPISGAALLRVINGSE